jgi:hypothetical protein
MIGTADVIQLSAFRPKAGESSKAGASPMALRLRERRARRAQRVADAPADETETCKNFRLRQQRRDDWCRADAVREYWKAAREMDSAIHRVQQHELPEGDLHKLLVPGSCWPIIAKYRAAIMAQLLTPAPTALEIEWKRAAFKRGDHKYTDVKPERIERAIADDLAFLAAHPVRRSNSETMARRREFKEAMRQRIKDIAASRDLSDEEIKPALSLKHYKLVEFVEKHDVNWQWLLEGVGRIFKKDPIRLSPNSTGAEFAAVVATMPEADQQAIRTMVREIVQERDQ